MTKRFKSKRGVAPDELPRSVLSQQLREVNTLLGRKRHGEALQLLNDASESVTLEVEKAKIITLVAQSQYDLGRYEEAERQFARAAELGAKHGLDPQKYLNPSLGRIRSVLKRNKVQKALQIANDLTQKVDTEQKKYRQAIENPRNGPQHGGGFYIPPKPVRRSVALTRMGTAFMEEGHLDIGKQFLELAVAEKPKGASRARQLLATCYLQLGQASKSEQYARESIVLGEFRAKTIPSWSLLIQARKAGEKKLLDRQLFDRLLRSRTGGRVKQRAMVSIISELRRQSDPDWIRLANWLRERKPDADGIIRVEIQKMILSEIKAGTWQAEHPAQVAMDIADEMAAEASLVGSEAISIAKIYGKYGLLSGLQMQEIQERLKKISNRFGETNGLRALHACALGMSESRFMDEARRIFTRVIRRAPDDSSHWGKAVWSLARLESSVGNHQGAAKRYLQYAASDYTDPALRLQAFLRWIKQVEAAGGDVNVENVIGDVRNILAHVEGYRPLLDAGRQLALAGEGFEKVRDEVIEMAEVRSLAAFEEATTTTDALVVLLALCRRWYYDFYHSDRLIAFYESLPEEKHAWLWSQDARYWEYISLAMRSYFRQGLPAEGEQIGRTVLENASVPAVGRVYLGVHYGMWLIQQKRVDEAVPLFVIAVEASPTHRLCSHAYYWLAAQKHSENQRQQAAAYLMKARKCLLPRPALLSEWEVDARAGLYLQSLNPEGTPVNLSLFSERFLEKQEKALDQDLSKLGVAR